MISVTIGIYEKKQCIKLNSIYAPSVSTEDWNEPANEICIATLSLWKRKFVSRRSPVATVCVPHPSQTTEFHPPSLQILYYAYIGRYYALVLAKPNVKIFNFEQHTTGGSRGKGGAGPSGAQGLMWEPRLRCPKAGPVC